MSRRRVDLDALPGSRPGPVPEQPEPQLATRVDVPPDGDEWIHEIKLDGYRIQAVRQGSEVRLLSRRGLDWSSRFPAVVTAVGELPVAEMVLDGEVVLLLPDGSTSFQGLQETLGGSVGSGRIVYFVFDLLHLDGHDLRDVALLDRKRVLRGVIGNPDAGPLRYCDHVRGQGPAFLRQACRLALEGAVSKRASSPYRAGRGRTWRKSKCLERQELVVGGFTDPSGARRGFGSLLLGTYRPEGELVYAGRVGTGFSARLLGELARELERLERPTSPFADGKTSRLGRRGVHWVEPRLVVEVEFTEWTRDGHLRHPSFQGLRDDVDPATVVREAPDGDPPTRSAARSRGRVRSVEVEIEGVRITHPDRILYPQQGITKRRLAQYYRDVGERMLEHVGDRPLTLVRCPKGREGECFYQKHMNESVPEAVGSVEIEDADSPGESSRYLVVDSVAGLVALVQISTLEIHTWGSRRDRLERPDRILFDLDPGEGVAWTQVVGAALEIRERLADLGLESFVKTTGGKGLHLAVPIVRRHTWDEVKNFSRAIARKLADASPERYLAKSAKAARRGRIYVDYLRNGRGATAVAPYSSRARAGAPVAMPLGWEELGAGSEPSRFTVETALRRLESLKADPWAGSTTVRQSITRSMREAVGIE